MQVFNKIIKSISSPFPILNTKQQDLFSASTQALQAHYETIYFKFSNNEISHFEKEFLKTHAQLSAFFFSSSNFILCSIIIPSFISLTFPTTYFTYVFVDCLFCFIPIETRPPFQGIHNLLQFETDLIRPITSTLSIIISTIPSTAYALWKTHRYIAPSELRQVLVPI